MFDSWSKSIEMCPTNIAIVLMGSVCAMRNLEDAQSDEHFNKTRIPEPNHLVDADLVESPQNICLDPIEMNVGKELDKTP